MSWRNHLPNNLLFSRAVKPLDTSLKISLNGDKIIDMSRLMNLKGSCKRVLKKPGDDVCLSRNCEEVLVVLTGLPSSFSVS